MLMLRIETRQAEGEPPCVFTWPPWSLRALLGHGPLVCLLCCTSCCACCLLSNLSIFKSSVQSSAILFSHHSSPGYYPCSWLLLLYLRPRWTCASQ